MWFSNTSIVCNLVNATIQLETKSPFETATSSLWVLDVFFVCLFVCFFCFSNTFSTFMKIHKVALIFTTSRFANHSVENVQMRSFFWSVFYLSVFSPNAGKEGPEKTPYLDTFQAVNVYYFTYTQFPVLLNRSR